MILTDKQIKQYGNKVIIEGYNPDHIGPVSYDIFLDYIITETANENKYELQPGESVFIRTIEELHVPDELLIRVENRNSLIRLGLNVTGPTYFPGHTTYMFLRVENVSANSITLQHGQGIAQLFYEQLISSPEITYDKKENASFNKETNYFQFGLYQKEYEKRINRIESTTEKLENTESRVYGNILTLMGIFVTIFSLIIVNYNIAANFPSLKTIVVMNVSLTLIMVIFAGLIYSFLNSKKDKSLLKRYLLGVGLLTIVLIVILCLPI